MPFPTSYVRAEYAANLLQSWFPELIVEPYQHASQGWYVSVVKEDADVGLLLHVDEIDNGAAGIKDDTVNAVIALRDGTEYVPPKPEPGKVYNDVMTYNYKAR